MSHETFWKEVDIGKYNHVNSIVTVTASWVKYISNNNKYSYQHMINLWNFERFPKESL